MTVAELVEKLGGGYISQGDTDVTVEGCYVSDLLSDVLANAQTGNLWITQHTHPNVVAVAVVKEISAVVIVGSKPVDPETLRRAEQENVTLVSLDLSAFEAAGRAFNLLTAEAGA